MTGTWYTLHIRVGRFPHVYNSQLTLAIIEGLYLGVAAGRASPTLYEIRSFFGIWNWNSDRITFSVVVNRICVNILRIGPGPTTLRNIFDWPSGNREKNRVRVVCVVSMLVLCSVVCYVMYLLSADLQCEVCLCSLYVLFSICYSCECTCCRCCCCAT